MSGATVTSGTASYLCDKCSVLYIDDKALGAHEAERYDGSFMSFDNDDLFLALQLDYQHTDLLPELPDLEVSAISGCAFCAALRDATLRLEINETGRAVFSMRYMWRSGLAELIVDIMISHLNHEANRKDELRHLRFFVDCENGRWYLAAYCSLD
jgi:hypothetical protein